MKFGAWIEARGLTHDEVARRLGCDRTTVCRYIEKPGKRQFRMPGREMLGKILAMTDGQVTPNDFLQDANSGGSASVPETERAA